MPFHNVTITDHYIFSWYIQSPCIPVASCLDNHRVITLIESTVFYQEVTGHFQIDSIIIVTVRFYIQIPGNTAITHVDMNSPKRAFPNFKSVKQYIPATVEMYQMRTKIVFSHRHLPFLYGNIRRGHRIKLFQCIQMGFRTCKPHFRFQHAFSGNRHILTTNSIDQRRVIITFHTLP